MVLTHAQTANRRRWVRTALIALAIPVAAVGALGSWPPGIAAIFTTKTVINTYDLLLLVQAVVLVGGLVGAGICIWRNAPPRALACLALVFLSPTLTSYCDVPHCIPNSVTWAMSPKVLTWSHRIRPVADAAEAEGIAHDLLYELKAPSFGVAEAKRDGEHWIVPLDNPSGAPSPARVIIKARTGRATLSIPSLASDR